MFDCSDEAYLRLDAANGNGRRALVAGLGASGRASADYLLRRGWQVSACDSRDKVPGLEGFLSAHPELAVALGGLPQSLPQGIDLVVMSPGISPWFGPAAALCAAARSAGVPVAGEIELFAGELAHLRAASGYSPKVIGITGTNGKTTTTTLVTKMAAEGGRRATAAGNIGPNAVTELDKALDAGVLPEVWVLELSSFQLDTTSSLKCASAAVLNVTEDHLDWHGDMKAYAEAKGRIFKQDTVRVVNREDAETLRLAQGGPVRTFGGGEPVKAGEYGLARGADGLLWLSRLDEGASEPTLFCPEKSLLIAGRHNAMNALAALALIEAAGLPVGPALAALAAYGGEPHRVERVLDCDGVTFIDDSKGTNVGAVAAAVKGFAAQGRRILIILGGDGKGQDFSPLVEALKGTAGAVALIGRDAPLIEEALSATGIPMARQTTLEEAVYWLWARHAQGDVLLLSPACASWDMFRDYAERSARFIACARAIAAEEQAC